MKQNGIEIKNKKSYILIEPPDGTNFWDIMKGIVTLFTMPAYQEKNDIWVIRNGHPDFLCSDLHEIKNFADEHYPKTAKARKTAIVVETELQRELANEYAQISKDLSREIKVFPNLKFAEEWISK